MRGDAIESAIQAWLRGLERCVRAVDYEGARPLFAPEVVGFGTVGAMLDGLEELVPGQWQHVWPNIAGFTFRMNTLRWGAEGGLAWAICLWDSVGTAADGSRFSRPGRATVILRREGDRWVALHTHFSLFPR